MVKHSKSNGTYYVSKLGVTSTVFRRANCSGREASVEDQSPNELGTTPKCMDSISDASNINEMIIGLPGVFRRAAKVAAVHLVRLAIRAAEFRLGSTWLVYPSID